MGMCGWVPSGHRIGVIVKGFQLPPLIELSLSVQYQRWKVCGDFSSLGFMPRAYGWALEVREPFKNYSTCYARMCQSVWGGIHSFIRCSRKSKTLKLLGISDVHGKSGVSFTQASFSRWRQNWSLLALGPAPWDSCGLSFAFSLTFQNDFL